MSASSPEISGHIPLQEGETRVYRASTGWKAFFLMGVAVFVGTLPLWDSKPIETQEVDPMLALYSLVFLFGFYRARSVFRYRVEVDTECVRERSFFKTKKALIKDYRYYRVLQTSPPTVHLFKDKNSKSRFSVNLMMKEVFEFGAWVDTLFENLEQIEYEELQKEYEETLANKELGATRLDREHNLKRVRLKANTLNMIALICSTLGAIISHSYLSFVLIALPLVALLDWKTLSQVNIILPSLGIAILLILFTYLLDAGMRKKLKDLFILIPFFCMYAYGAAIFINGYFDTSDPLVHTTLLLEKQESDRKYEHYYTFTISSWEDGNESKEVRVLASVFTEKQKGDVVYVSIREGLLGVPWFKVY